MSLDAYFESQLSKFGLSKYETRVLVTLLLRGPLTAPDTVKESGVPQPRIYDILSSLARKGFVESTPGRRKYYRAMPVRSSFGNYVNSMGDFIDELDSEIENKREAPYTEPQNIWYIVGKQRTDDRIASLLTEAKYEIIMAVNNNRLKENLSTLRKAVNQGITVAAVVYDDVDQETLSRIPDSVIIKRREGGSAEIVMIDRTTALLDLFTPSEDEKYALYFGNDRLVHLIGYYFYYMVWNPFGGSAEIKKQSHYTLSTTWLACEIIDSYLKAGIKIEATVTGKMGNEPVEITGRVFKTQVVPSVQHTFFIDTGERKYSVGGKTASIEDISMRMVVIKRELDQ